MGPWRRSAELQLCANMRSWAAQSWSSALRPQPLTRYPGWGDFSGIPRMGARGYARKACGLPAVLPLLAALLDSIFRAAATGFSLRQFLCQKWGEGVVCSNSHDGRARRSPGRQSRNQTLAHPLHLLIAQDDVTARNRRPVEGVTCARKQFVKPGVPGFRHGNGLRSRINLGGRIDCVRSVNRGR